MVSKIQIKNFKSIVDITLELGKTNVFIGENGCGKTNILEALALLGTGIGGQSMEDLSNKGVRIADESLMYGAFKEKEKQSPVEINFSQKEIKEQFKFNLNAKKWDTSFKNKEEYSGKILMALLLKKLIYEEGGEKKIIPKK